MALLNLQWCKSMLIMFYTTGLIPLLVDYQSPMVSPDQQYVFQHLHGLLDIPIFEMFPIQESHDDCQYGLLQLNCPITNVTQDVYKQHSYSFKYILLCNTIHSFLGLYMINFINGSQCHISTYTSIVLFDLYLYVQYFVAHCLSYCPLYCLVTNLRFLITSWYFQTFLTLHFLSNVMY